MKKKTGDDGDDSGNQMRWLRSLLAPVNILFKIPWSFTSFGQVSSSLQLSIQNGDNGAHRRRGPVPATVAVQGRSSDALLGLPYRLERSGNGERRSGGGKVAAPPRKNQGEGGVGERELVESERCSNIWRESALG